MKVSSQLLKKKNINLYFKFTHLFFNRFGSGGFGGRDFRQQQNFQRNSHSAGQNRGQQQPMANGGMAFNPMAVPYMNYGGSYGGNYNSTPPQHDWWNS